MIKLSPITWPVLYLLLTGCSSHVQKPPTQPSTIQVQPCPLVACRLPARPAVLANEQWEDAVLVTEDALKTCAAQVLACIQQQAPTTHHNGAPIDLGPSGSKI